MATDQSNPEREAAAVERRLNALKAGSLTSIRVTNGEEGTVVPLTEAEGKEVVALVCKLYEARSS